MTDVQVQQSEDWTMENLNRSKMENSKDMQAAITQAAIQAATVMLRAKREAELSAEPHTRRSIPEEHHRLRQARPVMSQSAFNKKAPDTYGIVKFGI